MVQNEVELNKNYCLYNLLPGFLVYVTRLIIICNQQIALFSIRFLS